ncbi:hypothetical protein [Streptomyces sp. NBC_00388]|uniref:hypothetical protein n=1 Tax=Streptomyces sp. NBC_00388 TaxID=2975735 RepID=UPI002E1D16C0
MRTEFRREAAHSAELQAEATADTAKAHRDSPKKDKEEAEAKLPESLKTESDAKKAAATQTEATQHKRASQVETTKASDAKD